MAATFQKKSGGTKGNGGVSGAIVPPRKQVDNFPLMTYLSQHCSFDDADDDSSLENEEALKVANDKRVDELLSKATSCVKNQSEDGSSSEEAARRSALELLHSMELERNMNETWKISESNPKKKDYRNFLYPLKPTKEDDYFSGVPKVKQARERKRCRSDEVVLLDNGKLVPKNSSLDYYNSKEVPQIPLKFSMPVRKPQRVPSVGLPFTPGPPVSTENNRWMQKSGNELFSNVQSQTLLVNGLGDDDLALAIAESIRTAKEEQQRNVMLETLYQSQNEAANAKLISASSRGNASWAVKPTPTDRNRFMSVDRNRSMSVDSTNQSWDEEMTNLNSKDSTHELNNNSNKDNFKNSERTTKPNEECLNQRPRHREEQKTFKSPPHEECLDQRPRHREEQKTCKSPPPMVADLKISVSHEKKVITLQAPDEKKYGSPMKQCDKKEEKEAKNTMNEEQMSENRVLARERESKQERKIPKTSNVPETFDSPITSSRLPTSKPTALMTAMKNFTQRPANGEGTTHNYVGHKARTTSTSPEVPPLLVVPKGPGPDKELSSNQPANDEEASHNYPVDNESKGASSTEVASLQNHSKKSVQEKEKGKSQQPIAVESLNLSSTAPEIFGNAALPQPQTHSPQSATLSSSISLEELPMASVQAQYHQMLLMQQGLVGTPQLRQNGQNFGGGNVQSSNEKRKPEMGQADQTAASMILNNPPIKTSSLTPTGPGLSDTSSAGLYGLVAGLQNTSPGSLPGLPNAQTPSMPAQTPSMPAQTPTMPDVPNSVFGGIPGLSNSLLGVMPPFSNVLPGSVSGFPNGLTAPGLTNPPSGMPDLNNLPGLINPYAGFMPGLTNPYPGILPGLSMPFSGGMPGLPNLLPGAAPLADSLQGVVPNVPTLPGGIPDSSSFPGIPAVAQHAGYPNGYPGVSVSSLSNLAPSGVSGFQNVLAQEYQMNPLSNMLGLQSNLPGGALTPVSSSLSGIQNCNSFGGLAQAYTAPQPGSAPLMGGRGRGRLAPASPK
ncbi:uncharacterized protein LOC117640360 [Thrips palmi]|uniref:Uncharacterized protein LOC117640360 n=1 Tax=Thrips palmi TaxID=161013 RepID=A0A6P8Y7W5_THRPL|nr:uncharacterized protein LOC117640360 [Thrips palmi]XP_034232725.1 uncharacterized protein LOC117640360 [Thrips palmi]XP_034232734.1 uncharacterized protein LOC117640360 [Thrips palmi]